MKQEKITSYFVAALITFVCAVAALGFVAYKNVEADSVIEFTRPNSTPGQHRYTSFFGSTATTTTATSTNASNGSGMISLAGAKKVTFYFGRGGATSANTGSSVFSVQVSPNGVDWYNFDLLILQSTGAASSSPWITAATSTVVATVDPLQFGFEYARCIVNEVTDGEHTCKGYVEY